MTHPTGTATPDAGHLPGLPGHPNHSTARELIDSLRNGSLGPTEVVQEDLARISARNDGILALRQVDEDSALRRARTLDSHPSDAPLFGLCIAIKDNVAQAGKPNRAGRNDAAGAPADADALIVRRLEEAGAIVIGRTNMDELAYGVTGTNPHTGQVRNPVDPKLHPGGSSAGSAAAVAAGFVPLAVGTDTAGSVRIPAALCGVVGIRPTPGTVPSEGIAPLAPSLDTAGPIAQDVRDAALLLSVMTARPELANAVAAHTEALRTLRVGALAGAFAVEVSDGIQGRFEAACTVLRSFVSAVDPLTIPQLAGAPRASGPIIGAEASHAWQEELDAHPNWFGEEVTRHLSKGATIKATRYLRARDDCAVVVRAIDAAFEGVDVLALPTTATTATPAGAPGPQLQFLALTVPFSLGGYPAITVPMGEVDGMPAGLQLVGKRGDEATLLALAAAFEQGRS